MKKAKIRVVVYLPRRLHRVITDIMPLFMDFDIKDPRRGAETRVLEHILQQYMDSEDYRNKLKARKELALKLFNYMKEKDREEVKRLIEAIDKS